MSSRSPARWMAPLALLVAIAAVGYVVSSATREDEPSTSSSRSKDSGAGKTTTGTTTTGAKTTPASAEKKTYIVKPGDTLGTIAETTGVTVVELQELNPELDPQSLTVGDSIRLRR